MAKPLQFCIGLALALVGITAVADECQKWFDQSKLRPGTPECLSRCVVLMTDMSTFACPSACTKLCKRPIQEDFLFQLSDLYPGLTPSERALATEHPKDSLKAFQLSREAEKLCLTRFSNSNTNDGSDACRHFVWAGLMLKEFGSEKASKFLTAHEDDSKQPPIERAMDLANNRFGLISAEQLDKAKNLSSDALLKRFDEAVKKQELVIIKNESLKGGLK